MAYRDTPYEAMMNRHVRTKLDYTMPRKERSSRDKMVDEKDRQYKEKMTDGGSSKEHNFVLGDHVLLRQRKRNKWSTPYEPVFYTVIKICGSAITARRITDGLEVRQDANQFKLANVLMYQENADDSGQSEYWLIFQVTHTHQKCLSPIFTLAAVVCILLVHKDVCKFELIYVCM